LRFLEEGKLKALTIFTNETKVKIMLGVGIPPENIMNVTFLKNLSNEQSEITMQNIRTVIQVTNIVDSSPVVTLHNMM